MAFNTAIFFDIENLIKGYSLTPQELRQVSLKAIVCDVKEQNNLEGIALLKAYANWSDPRLGQMRSDINELGIDPIQVFGFSKDQKKNAADFQLVIDAIELVHARPNIDTYVIVSGDGGFAALVKKLHEYGKTVIGCAYPGTTNNLFKTVCDNFVLIPSPFEALSVGRPKHEPLEGGVTIKPVEVMDQRNIRMARVIESEYNLSRPQMANYILRIIDWYAKDDICKSDMLDRGILFSTLKEAIVYAVPEFKQAQGEPRKLVEFMQFICTDTPYCIIDSPTLGKALAFRSHIKSAWQVMPDIHEDTGIHTKENYQAILSSGIPQFTLPNKGELVETALWLENNVLLVESFNGLIERATFALDVLDEKQIQLAILAFIYSGLFKRLPASKPLSEQKLHISADNKHARKILELLKEAVDNKLSKTIGKLNANILEEIMPSSILENLPKSSVVHTTDLAEV